MLFVILFVVVVVVVVVVDTKEKLKKKNNEQENTNLWNRDFPLDCERTLSQLELMCYAHKKLVQQFLSFSS